MTTAPCTPILRHVRTFALGSAAGDVTDGQLLKWFLEERDEAAFAALVRRHGPMVLGVCRRVLHDLHDAEDAFQATFLVFLRKAPSIAEPERLGNWLYGVAVFTARNAKTTRRRRQAAEQRAREFVRSTSEESAKDNDWQPVLDGELKCLPERYRVPLVLCGLEGRSRREAARQLGWSEGTLSSRLARGRELLRQRLLRRGVVFSTAALTSVLCTQTATAVPAALVASTVQTAIALAAGSTGLLATAAVALTEGVLQAMFLTKIKIAAVWLVIAGILGVSATVLTHSALADKPAAAAQESGQKEKPKDEAGPSLQVRIQEVDAAKQTITVVTGDKANKQEKTLPLAKEVKVLLREGKSKDDPVKEGKLTDLSEGQGAVLHLTADSKSVVAITPAVMRFSGAVVRVDAAQNSVTFQVKDKSGPGEKTIQLAPDAKVLLNDGLTKNEPDTEGKLADLTEGTHVMLQLSLQDKTKAVSVRVQGGSLQGELKGVDVGNSTITLTVKEDAQVVDKTLAVAKDARIEGGLAQLTPGTKVSVRMSVFDKTKVVAMQPMKSKDGEEQQ